MQKQGYFLFGRVSKTHGVKGELNIRIDVDDPYEFESLKMMFIEINKNLIPYFIQEMRISGQKAFVSLVDINSVEKAAVLCGRDIYLPESLIPRLDENQFYLQEIIGYEVTDIHFGPLGNIQDVIELPQQNLMQLLVDGHEILVPIHDETIVGIDKVRKTIEIEAPDGLIDLYLSN